MEEAVLATFNRHSLPELRLSPLLIAHISTTEYGRWRWNLLSYTLLSMRVRSSCVPYHCHSIWVS